MEIFNEVLDSNEFLLLQDISNTLSSSLNLYDSVSTIFEELNTRFGFMKAILTICDTNQDSVDIRVTYGINPKEIESRLLQKWKDITAKVLSSEKPVVIPHLSKDSAFLGEHDGDSLTEESFICLPLVLGTEKFGTLSVDVPFYGDEMLNNLTKLLAIVALMIAQEVRLRRLLDNEKDALRQENLKLKKELKEKYDIHNMIGKSGAMLSVYEDIKQVSNSSATVLVCGESGTGKELVAHAIHYLSDRSEGPFIRVNCGALPETLIESELFGYEKGAFTDAVETKIGKFEAANGGTIFLDEVAELTPRLQVKLLRVLQEKEITRIGAVSPIQVNVRVVAATNKDMEAAMKEGLIREDFYYRLHVFPIALPPLRDRRSDILLLAEHFLERYATENNKNINRISSSVIDLLTAYNWPGNVRELENCMERSVILCNSNTIQPTHLPRTLQSAGVDVFVECTESTTLKDLLNSFEKKIIVDHLHKVRGNVSLAARNLGSTARILGYKIKQLGISVEEIKKEASA